jgi:hypothetical protein
VCFDPTGSDAQLLTSFGASSSDNGTTVFGFHANQETMGTGTFDVAGLKCHFTHNFSSIANIRGEKAGGGSLSSNT